MIYYNNLAQVDGNGWSGRFKRLMTSNALVFKSTVFPEWWVLPFFAAHFLELKVTRLLWLGTSIELRRGFTMCLSRRTYQIYMTP
jgi:hypothetical protein